MLPTLSSSKNYSETFHEFHIQLERITLNLIIFSLLFCGFGDVLQDPIKAIHFGNSNPVCHAFDADVKDGHDLLIGLQSGDGEFGCLFWVFFPLLEIMINC